MIKLPDGELRDYLPSTMKNDIDMVCLSYAIKKATERLLKYQKQAMIYHFIDILPEQILDTLAVELRSPYYSDSMTIEIKRGIIKNTLRWYAKAGTPSAVNEMIDVVFGEGKVVEWPNFDEPPYTPGTFDIVTNAQLTPEIADYLFGIIDHVKNTRSHLRRLLLKRRIDQEIFVEIGQSLNYKPAIITGGYDEHREAEHKVYTGIKQFINYKPAAIIDGCESQRTISFELYTETRQFLNYKPAAIIEGYSTASRVNQELHTGVSERAEYKPPAVMDS